MNFSEMEFDDIKKQEHSFRTNCITIEVDAPRVFFTDLTDLHVGDNGFDEQSLTNFVDMVLTVPNFYVYIGGDSTNHANKGGKSSPFEEYMSPRAQIKGAFDDNRQLVRKGLLQIMEPLVQANRVIGIGDGNHNTTRLREFNDMSAAEYYSDLSGVRYFPDFALIEFVCGTSNKNRNSYVHHIHHTGSTGKRKNLNALQDRVFNWTADVFWGEHTHRTHSGDDYVVHYDKYNKKPYIRRRLYVNGNSYLSWHGYARAKGYPLGITGGHIVEMSGKRENWDIRPFDRPRDFVELVVEPMRRQAVVV